MSSSSQPSDRQPDWSVASERQPPLRLVFYGDDFTGSTDALEVLALAGLRCALFLRVPSVAELASLGGFDAIGIAGDSRAMTPDEMRASLPSVFIAMQALAAPLLHYKVCSTFDSAPGIGSIGTVIEIARDTLGERPLPIVAGTPALQRFCVFGNLFARSGTDGQIHRIDRHPIMHAHPVTPMAEADLIRHLGKQTSLRVAGFDITQLDRPATAMNAAFDEALAAQPAALLMDTASVAHLTEVGRLLDQQAMRSGPLFCIGSSGLEYALTQWWARDARMPGAPPETRLSPASPLLVLSGSASPLSATQIDTAVQAGFADVALDAAALVSEDMAPQAVEAVVDQVTGRLRDGQSVVMHTARGPADPRIDAMIGTFVARGASRMDATHAGGRLLGQRLGQIAQRVLDGAPVQRLVLSGGDTSSQVTQVLAPDALEVKTRLSPGAPLCRFLSHKPRLDGLEVALKGGQMGGADYFVRARDGDRTA
ncbi:four-carbon acid sugar kinase family protein [Chitinasiproducens palmae]|uniref:Uncharacterized conserved protein YgbK, DUF1537 family n=1 Tax=Chitinasiproducens palmae TaxID=1770053 RepID=A0A1H2PKA0_9BURK|nr:four-carbon acid sugar kinase family protein [Chitinasiproducens palmae]SDV46871.1 Uncharacterized conserved protein YgbK, DUF1537 family [Chitinasiproducens palmae]